MSVTHMTSLRTFNPGNVAARLTGRQFSSLSGYNYRVYFIGQTTSYIGTWMQTTAQAWLVLKITESPIALGTVVTFQFLPITLLALFGGVLADRLPKLRVLKLTQALSLMQAVILGTLVATDTVELWHVYVLALMLGTANALDGPVRQSFVAELVSREQLVNAVALNSSIVSAARIFGPAVAGVTIGLVGLSWAFFMNAASYVAVLFAFSIMRPAEFYRQDRAKIDGGVFAQVAEGVRYCVGTPPVLMVFILLSLIGMFGHNPTVLIPLVAEFVLQVGPEQFGALTSFMGVGALTAALVMAASRSAPSRALWGSAIAFVVIFAAIAVSESFLITGAFLTLFGVASVIFTTVANTKLQMMVPDELRGRVMSIFFLIFAGSTPIGGYLTGVMAEAWGVPATLLTEAALCLLSVVLAAAYYLAHRSEIQPEAPRQPVAGIKAAHRPAAPAQRAPGEE